MADDYERPVLDDNQEGLFLNFLRYCLKHQNVGSVGRGKILIDAVTFLRDTSQSQGTKVLTFYGQEYVGKTWLVEDLRSLIITDKKLFPALYKTYYVDLGGSGSSHVFLTVALIALIESIDSHVIYPTSSSVVYAPAMREAYIKAVKPSLSLMRPSLATKAFMQSTLPSYDAYIRAVSPKLFCVPPSVFNRDFTTFKSPHQADHMRPVPMKLCPSKDRTGSLGTLLPCRREGPAAVACVLEAPGRGTSLTWRSGTPG